MTEESKFSAVVDSKKIRAVFENILTARVAEQDNTISFKFTGNGMEVILIDKSMITTTKIDLRGVECSDSEAKFFDDYSCEEDVRVLVDTSDFLKILKRSRAGEEVLTITHHAKKERIKMKFDGRVVRTFSLRLVGELDEESDANTEELLKNLMEIEMEVRFKIDPELLNEASKDADTLADQISLLIAKGDGDDPNELKVLAAGDAGDLEVPVTDQPVKVGDEEVKLIDEVEFVDGVNKVGPIILPLSYVKEVLRASAVADEMHIAMGNNLPVRFEFGVGGSLVTSFVAPHEEIEEIPITDALQTPIEQLHDDDEERDDDGPEDED